MICKKTIAAGGTQQELAGCLFPIFLKLIKIQPYEWLEIEKKLENNSKILKNCLLRLHNGI